MQFLDSFSTYNIGKAFLVELKNVRRDNVNVLFQFDTGAAISLIGLNTICDRDIKRQMILSDIVNMHIQQFGIHKYEDAAKTVTEELIEIYPCVLNNVSIMGTQPRRFFFHIFLGNVNLPLLGFDFIHDCSFSHSIRGNITVTSVSRDAGKMFYPGKIIEFDSVLTEYYRKL